MIDTAVFELVGVFDGSLKPTDTTRTFPVFFSRPPITSLLSHPSPLLQCSCFCSLVLCFSLCSALAFTVEVPFGSSRGVHSPREQG